MSEQNKSNFQTLAAGFAGFAVVMVVGGGALMLHNSHQAKQAAHPAAAAAPIDIGSSMPRPMSGLGAPKERREESPAPLIGDQSAAEAPSARATAVAAASTQGAAARSAAPAAQNAQAAAEAEAQAAGSELEVNEHLATTGNGSSAEASVKNTLHKTAGKAAKSRKGATSATAGGAKADAAGSDALASVHYGVTNRNELMGRAAGPVYNFQGANKGGGTAANGKMAADAKTQIADIKKQLEGANIPPEQRAALLKQLDAAGESAPQ